MYFPWDLSAPANQVPYQFTTAYVVLALMLLALSFTRESKEKAVEEHLH